VLAAVLLVVPFLPGLGGGTALDPDVVQRDVAEQFEEREGVALQLSCDGDMTVEPGRSYDCAGLTADGEPVRITITVTDEDANYTWSEG
jgi:hypothetical protein